LTAFLRERLGDEDARTRRYAAVGLGKLREGAEGVDAIALALRAALAREEDAPARRAIVAALGKVGGETAIAALREAERSAPTTETKELTKARLIAERTLSRESASSFDPSIPVAAPTRVVLRCRAGLEEILASELDPKLGAIIPRDAWGPRVELTLTGSPEA